MVVHPNRGPSWVTPGVSRAAQTLLYITNLGSGSVNMYTWQRGGGLDLVGEITGFGDPTQPCGDGAGNIFIPDLINATITHFRYGEVTPGRVLDTGGFPTGCSYDRATGNLAVATYIGGNVVVFANAAGTPTSYVVPNMTEPEFVAYDTNGDLFVVGSTAAAPVTLAELPNGGSSFNPLTLAGGSIDSPGNIQWGGTFLLVGDQGAGQSSINQVTVSGSTATIVNNVPMQNNNDMVGFWARGPTGDRRIAAVDNLNNAAVNYNWPAGTTFSSTTESISAPFGAFVLQRGRGGP
jgi:hypothetical protein